MPVVDMKDLAASIGPDSPNAWWPRETACAICGDHAGAFYRRPLCDVHLKEALEAAR